MDTLFNCEVGMLIEPKQYHPRVYVFASIARPLMSFLKEKDYGNGVNCYWFIYKLQNPVTNTDPYWASLYIDEVYFKKRRKAFYYAPAIKDDANFQFFLHCSHEEWIKHITDKYLFGITQMKEKGVKNFEIEAFYQDVEAFFKEIDGLSLLKTFYKENNLEYNI